MMSGSAARSGSKDVGPVDRGIGERVRSRRLDLGMSLETLSDALGVSYQQVQKYEKGVNRISAGRLQQIAETLGVSLTELFAGDEAAAGSGRLAHTAEGLRLLRAFERVADSGDRRRILDLVERLASPD